MKLSSLIMALAITVNVSGPVLGADKPAAKEGTKSAPKAKEDKIVTEKEKLQTLKELSHKHKFHDKTESTGALEIALTKHINRLIKEKYEEIKELEHDLKQIDNKAVAPKSAPSQTHLRDNVDHVKEQIERKHGEHYTR